MSFAIVILSARAANLVPCVRAVLQNEPKLSADRIIIVDDGARREAEAQLPGVLWIDGIRPFIFARNANRGLQIAATDVILLNDDARLISSEGFTHLAEIVHGEADLGICSAGIRGVVGNGNQASRGQSWWRPEPDSLAFVCVYVRREVVDRIGLLDERFIGYGFEDNDYCRRARSAGFRLGVWDGCLVDHGGRLPSSYRTRPDLATLMAKNRRLFEQKWGTGRMRVDESVDLLYLACNRFDFTRETFDTLVANTDWDLVRTLFVIDDGSIDGTREWLEQNIGRVPRPTQLLKTGFGSPVTAMVRFIRESRAPILAKVDNDTMLPPTWLRQSLDVMTRHPELSLLGVEAMFPHDDAAGSRSYTPAEFISGLGLYRRSAFARSQPQAYNRWFGLEEWQVRQGPRLKRGWITPALPVFLLDRIPFQPWAGYVDAYVRRGWQRSWPKYDAGSTLWHWRWPQRPVPDTSAPHASVVERPRFVGAMRVKNEAPHLREVISRILPLCERVLVLDDHSTDETTAICRSFGERVSVVPSQFEGLDEARDKNFLLAKIVMTDPEWVLWIDGDEILESSGPQALRSAVEHWDGIAAYSLRIAYAWDEPEMIRIDGIYGNFRRPSLFRLRGQPLGLLHFPETGFGGNLHCGNVPGGLTGKVLHVDVRLKHLGYINRNCRQAKYRWYTSVDPNNVAEDNYRHLAEIPGARHAPGPPQLVPWIE